MTTIRHYKVMGEIGIHMYELDSFDSWLDAKKRVNMI